MIDENGNMEEIAEDDVSQEEASSEGVSFQEDGEVDGEDEISISSDVAYRGAAPAAVGDYDDEESTLKSFISDKNTLLAFGAFATIAAAVGGYVYFTSVQADVLSNPYSVAMESPVPGIVAGTVPANQSPLDMLRKRAEQAKARTAPAHIPAVAKKNEKQDVAEITDTVSSSAPADDVAEKVVITDISTDVVKVEQAKSEEVKKDADDTLQKQEILSEIMSVDDEAVAVDPEINSTLLSGTIPDDEKTAAAKRAVAERKAVEARKIEAARQEALANEKLEAEMASEEALNEEIAAAEAQKRAKEIAEAKAREVEAMKAVAAVEDDIAFDEAMNDAPAKVMAAQDTVVIGGEGVASVKKVNQIDSADASDAELAIIQNSTILDTLPAPSEIPMDPREKILTQLEVGVDGQTITDILAQDANIRPLPNRYVVVKKERDEDDVESKVTAARSALAQGRYVASLELFNNLYQEYPEHPSVLMGRAVSMQKLGQNGNALAAYEEVLGTDPGNLEALTNMLGILKSQDSQTALNNLQQLRELYPYNAEITAQLGMVYGMTRDYKNAVKYLEMAEALKPDDLNITYNKAVAYDKMGKSQKAAEIYRSIIYRASYEEMEKTFPIEAVKKRLASIH